MQTHKKWDGKERRQHEIKCRNTDNTGTCAVHDILMKDRDAARAITMIKQERISDKLDTMISWKVFIVFITLGAGIFGSALGWLGTTIAGQGLEYRSQMEKITMGLKTVSEIQQFVLAKIQNLEKYNDYQRSQQQKKE